LPFTPHTALSFESLRNVFEHALILSSWLSGPVLELSRCPWLSKNFTAMSTNKSKIGVARNPDRSPDLLEATRPVPAVYTTVGSLVDPNAVRAFQAPNRIQREGANRRPLPTSAVFNRSFGSSNSLFHSKLPLSPAALRNQNNMHYAQQFGRGHGGLGQLSVTTPLITSPTRTLPPAIRPQPFGALQSHGTSSADPWRTHVRPQPSLSHNTFMSIYQSMSVTDQITWGEGTTPHSHDIFTWFIQPCDTIMPVDEEPSSLPVPSSPKKVFAPDNIIISKRVLAELLSGETTEARTSRTGVSSVAGLDPMHNMQILSESENLVQDIARDYLPVYAASNPEFVTNNPTNPSSMSPLEQSMHKQRAPANKASKAMNNQGASSTRGMHSQAVSSGQGVQSRADTSIQGMHNQRASSSQGMQNRTTSSIQGMQASSIQRMQTPVTSSSQGLQSQVQGSLDQSYRFPYPGLATSFNSQTNPLVGASGVPSHMGHYGVSPQQYSVEAGHPHLDGSLKSMPQTSNLGRHGWITPCHYCLEEHENGSCLRIQNNEGRASAPSAPPGYPQPLTAGPPGQRHYVGGSNQANSGYIANTWAGNQYTSVNDGYNAQANASPWAGTSMPGNYNAQANASSWPGASMPGNYNAQAEPSSWAGASMQGNSTSQAGASSGGNAHGINLSSFTYDPNKYDLSQIDLSKVPFNPPQVFNNGWGAPICDTLTREEAVMYYYMGFPSDFMLAYQSLSEEDKIEMEERIKLEKLKRKWGGETSAEFREKLEYMRNNPVRVPLRRKKENFGFYQGQREFHETKFGEVFDEYWDMRMDNPFNKFKEPNRPNPFGAIGDGRPSKKTDTTKPAVTKQYTAKEWDAKWETNQGECMEQILNAALIALLRYSQIGPTSWSELSRWGLSPPEHIDPTPEGNRSVYGEDWGKPAHL
jgi:hypothetical protein